MFGWLMCLGSWLLERGLAREDYRRLGVKLAVVHHELVLRLLGTILHSLL